MFWWARVAVVKGLRRSIVVISEGSGGEGDYYYLSCAGEEGGADTAGLLFSSLETFSWSPGFTGRATLGLRLPRGVTELTILGDNNNLLLLSTELQDRESPVIPGLEQTDSHITDLETPHSHGDCGGLLTRVEEVVI